jgi:16S rRNA (uracil1498-N3)-methyltransferase
VLVDEVARPRLAPDQVHHLERVLRLRPGEEVVATDGAGSWASCRYVSGASLELDGPPDFESAAAPSLTVGFVPVKGERPEWVVQKLTELGVDRIVVLRSDRTVVRWAGPREHAAIDRLRRVAAEAAAQARRVWLPEVTGVVELTSLAGQRIALAEHGGDPVVPSITGIAVGPEGGWSDEELSLGWPPVALGDGVLRAETAAVVAGAILVAHRADTVDAQEWSR